MTDSQSLLDIGRRLSIYTENLSDENATEVFAQVEQGYGRGSSWDELLERRITLLIGRANTGKTSELKLLHERLREAGRFSFMLPLRAVYEKRSVDELFTPRSTYDEFNRWSQSGDEAVFLLDSVDEADLFREGAFVDCLRVLRRLLRDSLLVRARWVISSRPGSWSSAEMLALVRSELCPPQTAKVIDINADDETITTVEEEQSSVDVVVAALKPLSRHQAAQLLQRVWNVTDFQTAQELAQNLGLSFALESPGDLKWFSHLAGASPAPTSRYGAVQIAARRLVTARLGEMTASQNDVMAELEALCAASMLSRSWLFALREADSAAGSLPLSELLGHRDYGFEKLVRALPLTSDAGLQRIKFVPEHVQIFMAARWFAKRCTSTADDTALLDIFQRESLAGPLVPTHLLVCAGWISCVRPDFRERLLNVAPHVVLFLGDMALLTPADGCRAVEKTFGMLAAGHPLLPHTLNLSSDDYWHIGRPELVPTLVYCFQRHARHRRCAYHLLNVFASRRAPDAAAALREYFASCDADEELKGLCVEAIEMCGERDDLEWVARIELAQISSPDSLARNLACALIRASGDEHLVVQLCERAREDDFRLGLDFSDAVRASTEVDVLRYAGALLAAHRVPDEDASSDEAEQESMGPLPIISLSLLRGLVARGTVSKDALVSAVALLESIRKLPAPHGGYERFKGFAQLARSKPYFHRQALRVLARGLTVEDAFYLKGGDEGFLYASFDERDRELINELLVVEAEVEAQKVLQRLSELTIPFEPHKVLPPVQSSEQGEQAQKLKASVEALTADIEDIRSCSDVRKVTRAAAIAVNLNRSHRYSVVSWLWFSRTYGDAIADALKSGARRLWRTHAPLFDANDERTTYYQTIAGLIGLQVELQEGGAPERISPAEAQRAFDYASFEINQLPEWVPRLASRFPDLFNEYAVRTVSSWEGSRVALQHARNLVERLVQNPTLPVTEQLARATWNALSRGAFVGNYLLAQGLSIVARSEELTPELIQKAADQTKVEWCRLGEDPADLALWFSTWCRLTPQRAFGWLETTCSGPDDGWQANLVKLAGEWYSSSRAALNIQMLSPIERCEKLSRLYLLLRQAAPPEQDEQRTGMHTRTAREDAEWFRDSLPNRIAAVGGAPAYDAIRRLAVRAEVRAQEMRWLHRVAFEVAEAEAVPSPWTAAQFIEYAKHRTAPLVDPESLWKAVRLDVDEVVRNLCEGEFSPRRMLQQAVERDMQLWLSRELELLARSKYRVYRERELANGTTPDLTALSPLGHYVTLELKLGDSRSVKSLLSDLRRQLHDDYMQDEFSNHGLFVVMWREKQDPTARTRWHQKVDRIRAMLQSEAKELCLQADGRKHVEVRCFICPMDVSARNE